MPKIIGTLTTSSSHNKAVLTNSIFDEEKQQFQSQINAEFEERLSNISTTGGNGMSISGTFNIATASGSQYSSIFSSMSVGDMRMYLVTDSNGNLPSTNQTAVIVEYGGILSPAFIYFGKSADFGVSVGDILVFAKLNVLTNVCRIIPLNDVKPSSDSFPGADGLATVWDKVRINKIDGIEWTANWTRDQLPNYLTKNDRFPSRPGWLLNVDDCLQNAVYPTCATFIYEYNPETGRNDKIADTYIPGINNCVYFTCLVVRTSTNDGSFDTIEQTAYGRENDEGKIYKRIIFYKSDGTDTQYGPWINVASSSYYFADITINGEGHVALENYGLETIEAGIRSIIRVQDQYYAKAYFFTDVQISKNESNGHLVFIWYYGDYIYKLHYLLIEGYYVEVKKLFNTPDNYATKNEVSELINNAIITTLNTEI